MCEPGPKRRAKKRRGLDNSRRKKTKPKTTCKPLRSLERWEMSFDCLSLECGYTGTFCMPSRETPAEDVGSGTRAEGGEDAEEQRASRRCRNEVVEKLQASKSILSFSFSLFYLSRSCLESNLPSGKRHVELSKQGRQKVKARRRQAGKKKSRERCRGKRRKKDWGSERALFFSTSNTSSLSFFRARALVAVDQPLSSHRAPRFL